MARPVRGGLSSAPQPSTLSNQNTRQARSLTERRTFRIAAALAALAVAATASVFGWRTWSESHVPSHFNTTAAQWSEEAQWEGNEWVMAVRNSEAQLATAWVRADFTDPELIAAIGYEDAETNAHYASTTRFNPQWLTSSEFTELRTIDVMAQYAHASRIMSVDVAESGQLARVSTCTLMGTSTDGEKVRSASWWAWRTSDGALQAAPVWPSAFGDSSGQDGFDCWTTQVDRVPWTTPRKIDDVARDTVRAPLARSAYGLDELEPPSASGDTQPLSPAPDVVWLHAVDEPAVTGPLVDRFIDTYIEQSWAIAHRDFTSPKLVEEIGYEDTVKLAESFANGQWQDGYAHARNSAETIHTAYRARLLKAEPLADGALSLWMCNPWPLSDSQSLDTGDITRVVVRERDDGTLALTWEFGDSAAMREAPMALDHTCMDANATFAVWPHAVDTHTANTQPVRLPLDRDYYDQMEDIEG